MIPPPIYSRLRLLNPCRDHGYKALDPLSLFPLCSLSNRALSLPKSLAGTARYRGRVAKLPGDTVGPRRHRVLLSLARAREQPPDPFPLSNRAENDVESIAGVPPCVCRRDPRGAVI